MNHYKGLHAGPSKALTDDKAAAIIARFGNADDLARWERRSAMVTPHPPTDAKQKLTTAIGGKWCARSEAIANGFRSTRSHGRAAYEIDLPQGHAAIEAGRRQLPLLLGTDQTRQVGVVDAEEGGRATLRFSRSAGGIEAERAFVSQGSRLSLAYMSRAYASDVPVAVTFQTSASDGNLKDNSMSDHNEMRALGAHHNRLDLAEEAIRAGKGLNQFRNELLDVLGQEPPIASYDYAYHPSQQRQFSLTRLVFAEATNDWSNAGYEREVVQEARRNYPGKARGLIVSGEALASRTSMTMAGTAAGAVGTTLLGDRYIDALRPTSSVMAAGATMFPGLGANVEIPKNTGDLSAAWVAEGGSITESDVDVGTIGLTPKMIAGRASFTRHLLSTSTPAIDEIVQRGLLAQITNAIDKAALEGSGTSPTPRGVLNTSGIGAFTTAGTGVMTWAEAHSAMADVASANLDSTRGTWILHPDDAAKLATTSVDSGSGRFVLENGRVAGRRVIESTHATAGKLYFGLFEHVYIGMWRGLDLVVDPYTNGANGIINIYATQLADVAVAHPAAFTVVTLKTA